MNILKKDRVPRTKSVNRYSIALIASAVVMAGSLVNIPVGVIHHNNVIAQSSSAVNTNLEFKRSEATVTLKGIYTDTAHSALVARLGVDPSSGGSLPAKGSDYKVFVASDAYGKDLKEVDVLFGRLSTDGDMFLVLPQPTKEVYTVFVMNTKFLGASRSASADANAITSDSPANISDADAEKSITESLSDYNFDLSTKEKPQMTIKNDQADMISWRMTTDPAFHDPEYEPIVLDTTLLQNGTFNFEGMYDKLFRESAYQELSVQHDQLTDLEDQLKSNQQEYNDRLASNPNDQIAFKSLKETNDALDDIQEKKADVAKQLNAYESLTYNDQTFTNLQTKAKVVPVPND